MNHQTGIAWTHFPGYTGAAWNPYVGCSRVSPGCQNCYAERQAWRIVVQARAQGRLSAYDGTVEIVGGDVCGSCGGLGVFVGEGGDSSEWCEKCWGFCRVGGEPRWAGEIRAASKLDLPLRTKKPHAFFVNSMSDLFHERVTDEQIAAVFGAMAASPQHLFVILTKRIERVASWMNWIREQGEELVGAVGCQPEPPNAPEATAAAMIGKLAGVEAPWPLPNVFIGPSVEDQQRADERMPHAMKLAAAGWRVVVSYEPALGPIDWRPWLPSWLIVGAESGPGRRPFDPAWIPAVECADAGVALFVKQGSAFRPGIQGNIPEALWSIKEFPHDQRQALARKRAQS